jgi:peptide/nickel transport system substrate-binding protein
MKTFARIFILALCAALTLSACGGAGSSAAPAVSAQETSSQAPAAPAKEKLAVAIRAEPSTLDPHNSTALANFAVQRVVYDTLVAQDSQGKIVPCLAESWEVLDDLTVRFHLRDNVYFSNGDKLTAEDVRYSLQRSTVERGSASMFSAFDGEKTAVVDALTVDVKVKYPFAAIYNYLSSARGDILCKRAVEEMGAEAYARNPVGTGSFILKEWVTGDSLHLVRNDNYWGDKPVYGELVFRVITEPANRAIELETGGVDIIYDVAASDAARLAGNPKVKVAQGPGYKFSYMTMNMSMAPYDDIRVREALTVSLDMEAIVDSVYKGSAKLADSLMAPTVFGYKKVGPYAYNPDKAKTLLAEAGYSGGLKVVLITNEDRNFMDVAEIAQNMWKSVGVETEIKIVEQATLLSMAAEGTVPIGITSSTPTTGDPDHALMPWPSTYKSFLRINNPKIDEYLNAGKSTYDPAAREKVYHEALAYMWTQYNMIPICFTDSVYATAANVENFECHPGNTPDLARVTFS